MKLATKVISGFILMAVIMCLIGIVGIMKIKQIDKADTMLYERVAFPLGQLADISTDIQKLRVNIRDLMTARTKEDRTVFETGIKELKNRISDNSRKFEKTIVT